MAILMGECRRPGCTNEIDALKAWGEISLNLERRPVTNGPHVVVAGNICSRCTNDLMDWWNKK